MVGIALATGCAGAVADDDPFGSGASVGDGGTGSSFTSSITAASTLDGGNGSGDSTTDGSEDDLDGDADGTTLSLDAADDDADDGGTTGTTAVAEDSTGDDTTGGDASTGAEESTGGESTGDESTGVAIMCPQELTCEEGLGLGTVSGDTGSPMLAFNDTQPTWLEFQVTEDNDDPIGEELNFTVTLTSPDCCDFDLYVHRGVEGGSTGCDGFTQSSISVGAVDTVSMDWGEDLLANGVDDTVWVAVEIVPKNDECEDDQEWALVVEGDT